MDCRDAFCLMNMFIDGEISENEKIELLEHIEKCENCKKEFEELQETVKELRETPLEELPKNYHNELMQKLENEINPKVIPIRKNKKYKTVYKFIGFAAVFALFIVGGTKAGLLNMKDGKYENMPSSVLENEDVNINENTEQNSTDLVLKDNDEKSSKNIEENDVEEKSNEPIDETSEETVTPNNEIITPKEKSSDVKNNDTNGIIDNTNSSNTDKNLSENNENVSPETAEVSGYSGGNIGKSNTPDMLMSEGLDLRNIPSNGLMTVNSPNSYTVYSADINTNNESYNTIVDLAKTYNGTISQEENKTTVVMSTNDYKNFVEALKSKNICTVSENSKDYFEEYNNLSNELSNINEDIKNTNDENSKKELEKQIKSIENQISAIDENLNRCEIYIYKN
ncbi:MAG TPA: zf-HC2 domain-containing protein [Candidatus Fimicola cottocaccae]|nr:zf-HC2 domain-containing protein [Candidatus Fimicola cottocaccae]